LHNSSKNNWVRGRRGGGNMYRIMRRRNQEMNNVVGNRCLETEGGIEGTVNRGFAPYVAKKKPGATY
jgi:hypothetical protein